MNGYEKNNAYGSASTAYDYNTEEQKTAQRAKAQEYSREFVKERETRPSRSYGEYKDSFADDLYYGGAGNDAFLSTSEVYSERSASPFGRSSEAYAPETEESEDLMPSATTMQFLENKDNPFEDYREEGERATNRKFKINAKAKVLIAVYALVVLTIFALIILNTTLLKSLDKTVAMKHSQIETLTKENEALAKTLEDVSSDATIEQKALEMGMVKR